MVEFMSGYAPAMDRFKEEPIKPLDPAEDHEFDIEEPMIPIGELGTTSIDAGQGNILQNLENNIKFGTKKVQFVISGGRGGISSGVSSFGKDVRQALKEKAKATGVELIGVEISPSLISGLAGFDPQSGRISDERREADKNKVRDAIRFAADVSGGGGVDLWSQEFNRNIADAKWNKEGKWAGMFFDNSPDDLDPKKANLLKYLLDTRTGQPIQASGVRTGETVQEIKYMTATDYEKMYGVKIVGKEMGGKRIGKDDHVDIEGKYVDFYQKDAFDKLVPFIDPKTRQFDTQKVDWQTIQDRTNKYNERNGTDWEPEEYLYRQKIETNKAQLRGQSLYYGRNVENLYNNLRDITKLKDTAAQLEKNMNPEERERWVTEVLMRQLQEKGVELGASDVARFKTMKPTDVIDDAILRQRNHIDAFQQQATSAKVQAAELDEMEERISTPQKYAYERSVASYADMGLEAMRVTQERKLDKPIYIGPEIGWASESFGGHPEEFISLIEDARKKMAKDLIAKEGYGAGAAKEKAKEHIKGMMDTSHVTMWYKKFKRQDGWSDEKHLSEFNKWAKAQVRKMVEKDVVGGVQIVDSITGEHSHLPAGQGMFDIVGMVEEMKAAGFKGHLVSEGHEEDTGGFGQGRILTETWKAFGSNVGNVAPGRMGMRGWGGLQQAYFGHVTPPTYIVGAYAPSNEWSLWSETPFE
jgi:hypothetical protein